MDDKLESGRTLEALRRKNLEGKRLFIEELRRQKTMKSVSLLLEIMCDESWFLRELAIEALVESGTLAIDPLRRVLKQGLWYTRAAAARALGRAGDGESARDILALLDEPNRTVREAAVDAVQALAVAATPALARALAESPWDRRLNRLALIGHVAPDLASRLESDAEALLAGRPGAPASPGAAAPSADSPATGFTPQTTGVAETPESSGLPRASDTADDGRGGPSGAP